MAGCYVDNADNRRLGRVGKPYGTHVVHKDGTVTIAPVGKGKGYSSRSPTGCYVDNDMNRGLGRVGKPYGTHVLHKDGSETILPLGNDTPYAGGQKPRAEPVPQQQTVVKPDPKHYQMPRVFDPMPQQAAIQQQTNMPTHVVARDRTLHSQETSHSPRVASTIAQDAQHEKLLGQYPSSKEQYLGQRQLEGTGSDSTPKIAKEKNLKEASTQFNPGKHPPTVEAKAAAQTMSYTSPRIAEEKSLKQQSTALKVITPRIYIPASSKVESETSIEIAKEKSLEHQSTATFKVITPRKYIPAASKVELETRSDPKEEAENRSDPSSKAAEEQSLEQDSTTTIPKVTPRRHLHVPAASNTQAEKLNTEPGPSPANAGKQRYNNDKKPIVVPKRDSESAEKSTHQLSAEPPKEGFDQILTRFKMTESDPVSTSKYQPVVAQLAQKAVEKIRNGANSTSDTKTSSKHEQSVPISPGTSDATVQRQVVHIQRKILEECTVTTEVVLPNSKEASTVKPKSTKPSVHHLKWKAIEDHKRKSSENPSVSTDATKVVSQSSSTKSIIPYSKLHLEKVIGSGSFGEVHKGRWQGKPVAYKKLQLQQIMTRKRKKAFETQIALLTALEHPSFVKIFGVVLEEGNHGIIMEYMKCTLYRTLFIDETEFPEEKKKKIVHQITSALSYLHTYKDNSIAHGDLKTENVLLDKYANAKLADFGLRALKNATELSCASVAGAPRYSAPEILRGEILDTKQLLQTDVYSLGIIVFEVIVEEEAFEDLSLLQLVANIGQGTMRPSTAEISNSVASLLERCWDGDADVRPTAGQFLEEWNSISDLYHFG